MGQFDILREEDVVFVLVMMMPVLLVSLDESYMCLFLVLLWCFFIDCFYFLLMLLLLFLILLYNFRLGIFCIVGILFVLRILFLVFISVCALVLLVFADLFWRSVVLFLLGLVGLSVDLLHLVLGRLRPVLIFFFSFFIVILLGSLLIFLGGCYFRLGLGLFRSFL